MHLLDLLDQGYEPEELVGPIIEERRQQNQQEFRARMAEVQARIGTLRSEVQRVVSTVKAVDDLQVARERLTFLTSELKKLKAINQELQEALAADRAVLTQRLQALQLMRDQVSRIPPQRGSPDTQLSKFIMQAGREAIIHTQY